MIAKPYWLRLIIFVLLLTGCGVPDTATPAPTPQAMRVFHPHSLSPWADALATCASDNPLIALYFLPSPELVAELSPGDIFLSLGEPPVTISSNYLSQLGTERIVVIVNTENETTQLSSDQLKSIFSGSLTRWDAGSGDPLQVWVLPPGDAARTAFDSAVLPGSAPTTHALLAPHASGMLEVVARDASAVGYLPASALTYSRSTQADQVKVVTLSQELESALTLPVIALTRNESQGLTRDLLVCLQSSTP